MSRSIPRTSTAVLCGALLAAGSAALGADPECRCRAPGGDMHDLGAVECFDIGARRFPARCEMSTNTPYWRPMDSPGDGCPAPA